MTTNRRQQHRHTDCHGRATNRFRGRARTTSPRPRKTPSDGLRRLRGVGARQRPRCANGYQPEPVATAQAGWVQFAEMALTSMAGRRLFSGPGHGGLKEQDPSAAKCQRKTLSIDVTSTNDAPVARRRLGKPGNVRTIISGQPSSSSRILPARRRTLKLSGTSGLMVSVTCNANGSAATRRSAD